jgi:hypothetical protein
MIPIKEYSDLIKEKERSLGQPSVQLKTIKETDSAQSKENSQDKKDGEPGGPITEEKFKNIKQKELSYRFHKKKS